MRNAPCDQPSTRRGSSFRPQRNRYASSPGRNAGASSTREWRFPIVPPSVRTFTIAGSKPFACSTTAKRASVQISPFSQKLFVLKQRNRATAMACRASSSKRMRASVVAFATTARSAKTTSNKAQRNRRRSTKLISTHLQRAACRSLVQICVLDEQRSRARRGGRGNLQREVNDAQARGLFQDHRDITGTRHGVRHAGVEAA